MRTGNQSGGCGLHARLILSAAALFACAATPAASVSTGGSLVLTTDYVHRGLTQSGRKAAVQGDAHLQSVSGWFLGGWGSLASSEPQIQSRTEINLYLGRVWTLSPDWALSANYARYLYPDDRPQVRYYYDDYHELQMSLSFQDRATVSLALAPDITRYSLYLPGLRSGRQLSYEGSVRQPLWRNLSLTAGLGYYDLTDLFRESYWAWSAAAELSFGRARLTLTRFGADRSARQLFGSQTADDRWALTAAWRF